MLAVSLWRKSPKGAPGKWLTIIAFIISYKLFEGGALYTGFYQHLSHFMDLLPFMVLFVGPLLWLYVRQVTGKSPLSKLALASNFIPAVAIWLYNSPSVFRSSEDKIAMWNYVMNNSGGEMPTFYIVLLLAVKAHLASYLFFSWKLISQFSSQADQLRSDNSKLVLTNMQFMVVAFFILELTWVGLFTAQQFFAIGTLNSVSNIWLLFVAFMVLGIAYVGLQQPNLVFTPEECNLAKNNHKQHSIPAINDTNVKYLHSALPENTGEILAKEIEQHILSNQLFLNEKLTLTDLAKATSIKAHTLSQVINQTMKTNFYRLINGYRIQHAVDLIESNTVNWPLERIAYESGFANRVTFSKTFKEIMQCTPSDYKKHISKVS